MCRGLLPALAFLPVSTCGPASPRSTSCRPRWRCSVSTPIGRCLDVICGRCSTVGRWPPDPFYQESLFGRLNCHWAALRGWVQDDWKLITGAEPELYNLADDPAERRNLASTEPDRVRRMTDDLQRGLQRLAPGGDRAQPRAVSAEQEERLRSLGYTAGSGGSGPLDDPSLPDPRTHVELYDRLQAATVATGPALARAFDDVQAITRLDPDNPFAFGTLASMAYRYGSLSIAARSFARALELDPDRPGVRQNYGKLLRELNAIQIQSANCGSLSRRAKTTRGRASASPIRWLPNAKTARPRLWSTRCWRRSRRDPEALGVKGRLLAAQGRINDALPYFEKSAAAIRRGALHRAWPRVRRRQAIWRRRAAPPARRCAAVPAIHGRWPCSATSLIRGRTTRRGNQFSRTRRRHRPATADRVGDAGGRLRCRARCRPRRRVSPAGSRADGHRQRKEMRGITLRSCPRFTGAAEKRSTSRAHAEGCQRAARRRVRRPAHDDRGRAARSAPDLLASCNCTSDGCIGRSRDVAVRKRSIYRPRSG